MPETVDIRIRGLKELNRALSKADKDLAKEVRGEFRSIALQVATTARTIATSKGLRETGDLVRNIRPFVTVKGAGVRSGAIHRGFAYPMRLEFEGRHGRPWGPRASLYPALAVKANNILDASERLLDNIADDFGKGPS